MGQEFDLGLWWPQELHKKVLKCSGIRLVDMALCCLAGKKFVVEVEQYY